MSFLKNKRALILGMLSDRSIAYGIADAMHKQGAELAFTHQVEKHEQRVRKLASNFNSEIVLPCDVSNDEEIENLFIKLKDYWDTFDILVHSIAFVPKDALQGDFVENTSRENFKNSLSISCFSFIDIARRSLPLMPQGGSLITLTYQGSNRVSPFYNVMGAAKAALESSVRYLANDLGPNGVRVNAISPGPMKTLAGAAIGGARKTFRQTEANAPLRSNATLNAIGSTAVYLASEMGASTTGEIIRVDGGYHVLGMPQSENL